MGDAEVVFVDDLVILEGRLVFLVLLLVVVFGHAALRLLHGGGGHVEVGEVGNAYFDADVEEDGYDAEHVVGEAECLAQSGVILDGAFDLTLFELWLGELCGQEHDEREAENAHGDEQGGPRVDQGLADHGGAEQVTDQDGADGGSQGVARAAELYELVAALAASAQGVEHGVDDSVEHAHGEAGHESSDKVDGEDGSLVVK